MDKEVIERAKKRAMREYKDWVADLCETPQRLKSAMIIFEEYLDEQYYNNTEMVEDLVNTFKSENGDPLIFENNEENLNRYLDNASGALKEAEMGYYSYYDTYVSFNPLRSFEDLPYPELIEKLFYSVLFNPELYGVYMNEIADEE